MENIADFYYNKLADEQHPGKLLTSMLFEIFPNVNSEKYFRSVLIAINKAIGIYGRYNVYFAILLLSNSRIDFDTFLYPLLSKVILNKFKDEGRASGRLVSIPLEREVERIKKKIDKTRKDKPILENPFDE